MSEKSGMAERLQALRESAEGALRRLAPGRNTAPPPRTREDAPRAAFADPTAVSFPGDADDDDDLAALPLAMMLERSAHDIVRRADSLREDADRLIARIGDRIDGEITMRTQAARFFISTGWLAAAVWLYVSALNARAEDMTALPTGMPVDHAFVLMRVFMTLAAAGFGVAFLVGAIANLTGRADNRIVRAQGEELGKSIADASRDFDRLLTQLRDAMNRRANAADSVVDLSRAHLIALEACAYFRTIGFLTYADGDDARRLFSRFLWRRPANPAPIIPFVGGVVITATVYRFIDWYFFTERPPSDAPPLPITEYPWAMGLLFFGGLAYAGVGLLFSIFGGAVAGNTAAEARGESLDALRGAFTSREAPRPNDVIRRIEDAVDVFRARVGGRAAGGGAGARDAASNHSDDDAAIPHWRRRDSSARFVDSGFQAAPETWRADAFAKKFAAGPDEKPGAKRGLFKLKNPRRD
ncbi:MAG: hypothetical protein ACX939_02660 [Hyphococcus sp.]